MKRTLLLLAAAGAMAGADPQADPHSLSLQRAIEKVNYSTTHIPNYTCVETVERHYFQPAANTIPRACSVILKQRLHPTLDLVLHHFATDRLRLDVALLGRGEIFSWPGASRFEDESVGALVHTGPIGTGAFGAFLTAVFKQDVQKFVFHEDVEEDGKALLEFRYEVPVANSNYRVSMRDSWIHTAYSGTVLVDPRTDTVVRLVVQTAEMPPATGSCMTTTTLDLSVQQLGSAEFLLARRAQQRFVAPDGNEVENTTTLADCREYRGESTISFGTPAEVAAARAKAAGEKPAKFSAGLKFRMSLGEAISSTTAAAGDRFYARLLTPLHDTNRKLDAPAGSWVQGRILRVEAYHTNPRLVEIVFRPETVDVAGRIIGISAVRDQPVTGRSKVPIYLPLPGEDRAGLFRFEGDSVVVPATFRSDWKTVE